MTSSLKRKATEYPAKIDTDDGNSSTRESKKGRYDTSNSLEADSSQNTAQTSPFLSLPPEMRLQIYDLLLVCRTRNGSPSYESIAKDYQQPLFLNPILPRLGCQSMFPAILQTCKQIYYEAISILYGSNVFDLGKPAHINKISRSKLKFLRHLVICPCQLSVATPWVGLLDTLIDEAKDLRNLKVVFDARYFDTEPHVRGLGADVPFVRELARIKQVETLERLAIAGFYAKHWPSYLQQEMGTGVKVTAEAGMFTSPAGVENTIWSEMQSFQVTLLKKYQESTENLMP
ncbi:uncharacterized protein APUU_30704A [Aspergillus puulaauensis]|uniref:DUF7730 domain-containing protein n=1 Tax=Aspergillus puulaauensis TaxID=1220207 RepID=A0A7R8AK56_9EURO|nr:uncharacterized protein APUU_30704A [Aspergillus puulaauensis]BCS22479.1 hypothetical protein APUU_30704A [Aspergillus puulaauensis]